jgi:hypothetical protein
MILVLDATLDPEEAVRRRKIWHERFRWHGRLCGHSQLDHVSGDEERLAHPDRGLDHAEHALRRGHVVEVQLLPLVMGEGDG